MSNQSIIEEISKIHSAQLKNTSIKNKKLLICFSGIAGAGKTYIAKILEERYRGVRIRSDDIRDIVRSLGSGGIDNITYKYLEWFFNNYHFKNGLMILDKGIDRKYKETFSLFSKKGYKIFIIRVKVSRKLSEERIRKKLGKLDENYINSIDRWINEWEEFGKKG